MFEDLESRLVCTPFPSCNGNVSSIHRPQACTAPPLSSHTVLTCCARSCLEALWNKLRHNLRQETQLPGTCRTTPLKLCHGSSRSCSCQHGCMHHLSPLSTLAPTHAFTGCISPLSDMHAQMQCSARTAMVRSRRCTHQASRCRT